MLYRVDQRDVIEARTLPVGAVDTRVNHFCMARCERAGRASAGNGMIG
jgi:hypothetical protein